MATNADHQIHNLDATMVETMGLEPTTPWLQTRCSTN
jgi:hypothetical protein